MDSTNRREFLRSSAAVAAGVSAFAVPAVAKSRKSANDRIRIGMVGLGRRMVQHIAALNAISLGLLLVARRKVDDII